MYDVNMFMLRAWDVVEGAGMPWVELGTSVSRGGAELKKRAPSRVYQRREGQVRAGGDARVAVAVWCTWHGGTAWLGVARHVVGAVWGVVWGEVRLNVCVLCGAVFGWGRG